ncbi:protein of unknown function [Cupriavidus taiwanensis]|uniref:Uncharacterized protein n=1 Tax=Cupriavidus taiwanensis TaxID=164546 RepID=A0A375IDQ2_9BURK|nr:protein of unknown function [Cupriavidus taiwanensis]
MIPKTLLSVGLVRTQQTSERRLRHTLALTPCPSPASGRGEQTRSAGLDHYSA